MGKKKGSSAGDTRPQAHPRRRNAEQNRTLDFALPMRLYCFPRWTYTGLHLLRCGIH